MSAAPAVELAVLPIDETPSAPALPAVRTRPARARRAAHRPLVLLRPAPRREPPFDDELPLGADPRDGWYEPWLPFETLPARARARRAFATRPAGLPDPAVWGRRLLVGLTEAADGRRGVAQLNALLSPSVARGLAVDFDRDGGTGSRRWLRTARVVGARSCEPADGVAEVSATLDSGGRVRAVAMRLEVQEGRWRCVRLQLG